MDKLFRFTKGLSDVYHKFFYGLREDTDEVEGSLAEPLNILNDAISAVPDLIQHDYDRIRYNNRMDILFNGAEVECNIPTDGMLKIDENTMQTVMAAATPLATHSQHDGLEPVACSLPPVARMHTDQEVQDNQTHSDLVERIINLKPEQLQSPIPLMARANPNSPYNYNTYRTPSIGHVPPEENNNEPNKEQKTAAELPVKNENTTEHSVQPEEKMEVNQDEDNPQHPLYSVSIPTYQLSPHVVDKPRSRIFSVDKTRYQLSSERTPGNQLVLEDTSGYQHFSESAPGYQLSTSENQLSSARTSGIHLSSTSTSVNQLPSASTSENQFPSASTSSNQLPTASTSGNPLSSAQLAYLNEITKGKTPSCQLQNSVDAEISPVKKRRTRRYKRVDTMSPEQRKSMTDLQNNSTKGKYPKYKLSPSPTKRKHQKYNQSPSPTKGKHQKYQQSPSPTKGKNQQYKRSPSPIKRPGQVWGCNFCKYRGVPPEFFMTHQVKDKDGIVECPLLRTQVCAFCGATGDHAHCTSYCPHAKTDSPASAT